MEKKISNLSIKRRLAKKASFIRGFSLLEVLVSVAILLAGIISIVNFFPLGLKAQYRAGDLSRAALLANMKAEEIRRDADKAGELLNAIRNLRGPSQIITFPNESRLAYCFSGMSLKDPRDDPDDTRDDYGVARVIIMYSAEFRGRNEIIYELRFDQ